MLGSAWLKDSRSERKTTIAACASCSRRGVCSSRSLTTTVLLNRLLDVAREMTGARYAAIGVLDEDRRELARFVTSGVDEETRRAIGDLPRGRGILGELIRQPEPLRLERISDHPRSYGLPPGHPPMTTFLGAPILIRGNAWGNIYLTDKEDGGFTAGDEQAIVILAEWAAIAIANARLYQDVEDRRDELESAVRALEATTAIAGALGGETDLDRVLELAAKRARALVEARSLLILLREEDELEVAAVAGELDAASLTARLPVEGTVPGEVVRSGVAERLADVSARLPLGLGRLTGDARTALLVPLRFRGRTSGVLVALDRLVQGPQFDAEDERLLRAFAISAATAVATAKSVEADRLQDAVDAAELERGRWARELHDETLQALGAMRIRLETALQGGDTDRIRNATTTVAASLGDEIEKLQVLITELRPAALHELGLEPALKSLVQRADTAGSPAVTLAVDLDRAAEEPPGAAGLRARACHLPHRAGGSQQRDEARASQLCRRDRERGVRSRQDRSARRRAGLRSGPCRRRVWPARYAGAGGPTRRLTERGFESRIWDGGPRRASSALPRRHLVTRQASLTSPPRSTSTCTAPSSAKSRCSTPRYSPRRGAAALLGGHHRVLSPVSSLTPWPRGKNVPRRSGWNGRGSMSTPARAAIASAAVRAC